MRQRGRLERKQPRRYGDRVQVSVQQELEAILDRLKQGLDGDTCEKVLQLIAAENENLALSTTRSNLQAQTDDDETGPVCGAQ